jgi:hypothetical protein
VPPSSQDALLALILWGQHVAARNGWRARWQSKPATGQALDELTASLSVERAGR